MEERFENCKMNDINKFKESLIKDLYDLSVNCDITVEELADDIYDECRHFYNRALEDFIMALKDESSKEWKQFDNWYEFIDCIKNKLSK